MIIDPTEVRDPLKEEGSQIRMGDCLIEVDILIGIEDLLEEEDILVEDPLMEMEDPWTSQWARTTRSKDLLDQ